MRYMTLCITLILAGCAVATITPSEVREAHFPPLGAIAQGDFDAFLIENHQKQPTCEEDKSCAMVLFNLGFVYAYPYSPHYDRQKALSYFDTLLQNYTHTPWALQGRWWRALLHETLTLEAARERLQADLKSYKEAMRTREEALEAREAALRSRESTMRSQESTVVRSRESTVRSQETAMRTKQATIRFQGAAIRDLQTRLHRSREIDAQIDKIERELLH
jgi:hypothetical protein